MKKIIGVFLISFFLITACVSGDSSNEQLVAAITAQAKTIEALSQSSDVSTQTPVAYDCTNRLEFVADVSIPDGTVFKPGALFTKTWRLKNTGTCTWTTTYNLVFDLGNQMSAPAKIAFSESILPGETTDFSVNMTAPSTAGEYRGDWKLMSDKGVIFGRGRDYAESIFVVIVVNTSAAANPGGQSGQNGNRKQGGQQEQGGNPPAAVCNAQNPCGCIPPGLSAMSEEEFVELLNPFGQGAYPKGTFGKTVDVPFLMADVNDFEEIYDILVVNGVDVQVNATYVDANGIQQNFVSELTCEDVEPDPTMGRDELDMWCEVADPLPGVTDFLDVEQEVVLNIDVVSFGVSCWGAAVPVLNYCSIPPEERNWDLPQCAGGMGGGPGGLATVVPTMTQYVCSQGYHWCGFGTMCCPKGYDCCVVNGERACCKK